jgi:hypothetical protein
MPRVGQVSGPSGEISSRLRTQLGISAAHAAANAPPPEAPSSATEPTPKRIQDQGRFRDPVHNPIEPGGVRAADAGAIRGYETQSELVGCAREAVRGQPGIG